MTSNANNFASFNLHGLERTLLATTCVLKLYCENFNIHVVRLETACGKLVASGEGFSFIPNLEKISKQAKTLEHVLLSLEKLSYQKKNLNCVLPFSPKIVDTKLDIQLLSGAKVIIKRISSDCLTAVVEDWTGDILFTFDHSNLSTLLSTIEEKLQEPTS